jgi:hypothetical protein
MLVQTPPGADSDDQDDTHSHASAIIDEIDTLISIENVIR